VSYMAGRLLGFDIRLALEDYATTLWSRRRREIYLLNPDVDRPLSVDNAVWPSFFRFPALISNGVAPHPLTTIQAEAEYIDHELWLDVSRMRRCFADSASNSSRGMEIGIELIARPDLTSDQFGSSILEKSTAPSELPTESKLLGYDVADASLLSGLSNCSYSDEERLTLGRKWSAKLNEHGLFADLDSALEYKKITDVRVAEHAPFWVFSLYHLSLARR